MPFWQGDVKAVESPRHQTDLHSIIPLYEEGSRQSAPRTMFMHIKVPYYDNFYCGLLRRSGKLWLSGPEVPCNSASIVDISSTLRFLIGGLRRLEFGCGPRPPPPAARSRSARFTL
jgi:hypothetical protein